MTTLPGPYGAPALVLDAPDLPPGQQRVVMTIALLTLETGRPPTLREVAAALGISSLNAVWGHVEKLARKGWLTKAGARTLQLAKQLRFREAG